MSVQTRDPRLGLRWVLLTKPSGAAKAVTAFDPAVEKLGLGVAHGIQGFRDGLGRIERMPVEAFRTQTQALKPAEVAALLPPLAPEFSLKRFPGLASFSAPRPPARPAPKKVPRSPAVRRKPASPAQAVPVVRKGRIWTAPEV